MRFQQNDAAKWTRRASLKNVARDNNVNGNGVVHHNTLNARTSHSDDAERSREVERFFDLMTPATPARGTRP